jgi:hypothetical protein
MISMYYVLWATKAKKDYIGTYTDRAIALEVAAALNLTNYLIEEKGVDDDIEIEIR